MRWVLILIDRLSDTHPGRDLLLNSSHGFDVIFWVVERISAQNLRFLSAIIT